MELSNDFFNWINEHITDDPSRLRLKMHGKDVAGIDAGQAILQIECRRKYAAKFAETLARAPHFYFPAAINAEQATSDRLARFHASLCGPCGRVADMTAGLGIDVMHLARECSAAIAIEQNPGVADVLRYNAACSKINNLNVICSDCRDWLAENANDTFDCLFIDPARRAADGSRVFALSDCSPDLTMLQDRMLAVAPMYLAKVSPMLDISHMAGMLTGVRRIIAVGTTTECKELVVVACRGFSGEYTLSAVTLFPDGSENVFTYTPSEERTADADYGLPVPGDILFEPWPAVMKTAPLKLLSQRFGLTKIAANTQLYFMRERNQLSDGMPGRRLEIVAVLPYSSAEIKRFSRRWPVASVTARNFGVQSEALRKKLGVRDGGDIRVFAVSDGGGKRWLIVAS